MFAEFLYCLLLYFPNFQEDILYNEKVVLYELLEKYDQVVCLIHALKAMDQAGHVTQIIC